MFQRVRTILILAYYVGVLWIRRVPISLLTTLISPFTIIFFIFIYGGTSQVIYGIIGSLVFLALSAGLSIGPVAITHRLEFKYQQFLVSSPVGPLTYTIGLALGYLAYYGFGFIVLLGLFLEHRVPPFQLFESIVALVAIWLVMAATGFMISTLLSESRVAFQITNGLSAGLGIMPPVFYSYSILPKWLQTIAYIIPTSDAASIMQNAVGLMTSSFTTTALRWILLFSYFVIVMSISIKFAKWREN
jgi:ABC-2 type transport system permease protein